ncbi:MAG: hypothetical protein KKA31_03025 [Candidatus Margulisbacteria bacterium]|nr:hypothetical protein [Candidatus Margulisiibacteriota bacterium]
MKKGLNLVELSLILLAVGVLIAVTLPRFMDLSNQVNINAARGVLDDMRAAIAIQYANNSARGIYPAFPPSIEASMFENARIPVEPISNSNAVQVGSAEPAAVSRGWYYDRIRGRIFINNKNYASY